MLFVLSWRKKKLLSEEGARIVRRILKTLTKLLLDYMEREERRVIGFAC